MDFKAMLAELKQQGKPVAVALPDIGVVEVKIGDIKEDIVKLEREATGQKFFLHYTSVIVVT
jgi:hypothetical protein